ncbi:VapE domain-containing protein [Bradyrhizobium brasilense]|uniref:VapE family protein n=1 Tax=Bradyrhizobium brasilense TaxID=1419277 RepID=A0ABY8JJY3_9BRAD|nr:VapE domain-containing protein [Bradyrhizobium brasilense]WFU64841.1 VapE family protein [Bradyrhizobium brasilense]
MSAPKPDFDAAIEFLQTVYPAGPWVLTAIRPDRKAIETRTFYPAQAKELEAWLRGYEDRNIYWSVNPPLHDLNKKAEREDIKEVAFLHVDIDPRAGEDLTAERARCKALLGPKLPLGVPTPTAIVFSGGGYQAFWKLETPIPVNGKLEFAEDAKRWNQQLEFQFGGDNCHNIDRIMRLPGTINIPDAKKRAKGRATELARLVEYNEVAYPLSMFAQAPAAPLAAAAPAVELSGNVERLADINELDKWNVSDRVKVICVQGRHPDEPKEGDNSRSAWVFDCVCNLVRCGVPDEVVFSVLLDPEFGISESIREKDGGAERYATRQIEQAKKQVALDKLEFIASEKGVPLATEPKNIVVAMRELGVKVRYDIFSDRALIDGLEGEGPHLDDNSVRRLRLLIKERFGFLPAKDLFYDVVLDVARQAQFHPVVDYLDGLVWDGVPRIDGWLTTYGGAPRTDYTRAVGLHWLTAAVRRVRQPGVKFDELLVLESAQGTNKSTALRTLAVKDEWFTDNMVLGAKSKEVIEVTQGHWIIEAAELHGLSAAKSELLKSFLSRQSDNARMSYERLSVNVQRQCVLAGTTNSAHYLRDPTGNRRIWPVPIKQFDMDALRRDLDQLWAEAAVREATGVSIHLEEALWTAAAVEQEARVELHPFVQDFEAALSGLSGMFRCVDAWTILGLLPGQRTQQNQNEIGTSLRKLGWERKRQRVNGVPTWCYVKGGRRLIEVKRSAPPENKLTLAYQEHREEKFVQEEAPF